MLILPGDPLFDYTLATVPTPGSAGQVYVAKAGSGILQALDPDDPALADYLFDGEYDQRLEEIEEDALE